MKVLVIGANGTIGRHVVSALEQQHEVVSAGRTSGDVRLDVADPLSVANALEQVGPVDAIICAAGQVAFNSFLQLSSQDWEKGIQSRLMGQINLTQIGGKYLKDGGSITLTTGITADRTIRHGVSAATLNGAIQHFVQAVSSELPRNIRINAVSPTVLTQSVEKYADYFPGYHSVDGDVLASSYVRSVLGAETGQTYRAFAGN